MRTSIKYLLFIVMIVASTICLSQTPTPTKPNDQKILIRYATAHVGNGEIIDNAYIVVEGDELSMVANGNNVRLNILDYDTIIDADGKHVYPGFIVMDSRLGLTEIDQVNATHDFQEVGEFLPNVRAISAFNSESKIIPTVRSNGVLMAQIAPVGGVVSGSSSVVHFDGWSWKDASVRADEGKFLNWPNRYNFTGWWAEPGKAKSTDKYETRTREIVSWFEEARSYCAVQNPEEVNLRFEAMRGLFNGTDRLYVRVDWAKDILDVIQFLKNSGISKYAIVGGAEAHLITTELKENNAPVIINRVDRLPDHEDDPLFLPYQLASVLSDAGVQIAFATNGSMEAMLSRNLPFQVGTAIHYGLDREKALASVTSSPAQLLGISKNYGTLEAGKKATLFISSGDVFDMKTNDVEVAIIEGKIIELTNHQEILYRKFSAKFGIEP